MIEPLIVDEPRERLGRVAGRAVELGTVAGGKDRSLFGRPRLDHRGQRRTQPVGVERDLLADRERCALVVEAEGEELHGGGFVRGHFTGRGGRTHPLSPAGDRAYSRTFFRSLSGPAGAAARLRTARMRRLRSSTATENAMAK